MRKKNSITIVKRAIIILVPEFEERVKKLGQLAIQISHRLTVFHHGKKQKNKQTIR